MASFVAAVVASCASVQSPPPTEDVPLPAQFSAGEGEPLAQRWWRHFDDPRLNALMAPVLEENFSLAAARARLRQAGAAARIAGAEELPSLDASGDAQVSRQQGRNTEQYSVGAAASYEIDLWGRIDAAVEAARLERRASGADLQAAAISVTAQTATTFYSLLRQRAIVDLLESQRRTNQRITELIDLRYRNGQAQLDELLRQRRLTEATVSELESARAEQARLRHQLAALLGKQPQALDLPEGHERVSVPPLPEIGVPSQWLNRRPDLRAAWLRVRGADAEIASAIAAQYPRLDLTASIETVANEPGALFDSWIKSLAAGLTVPLFRGGALEAEEERSRAARAVAFNEYAQTVLDAVAEVETALSDARHDRRRLESLDRQVALAEQVAERLRQRYLNGASDYLDVLSAFTTLQEAQRQRLQARWALVFDRITLIRAIAGAWWEPEAGSPNEDA